MIETKVLATSRRHLLIVTVLLLIVAASRILRLNGLEMDIDEVWSIWQTLGTPRQVLAWVPYDWPPLYYLALAVWKEGAGIHPVAVRYSSVLLGLCGVAFTYRLGRHMRSPQMGLLAAGVYAALGYAIFLSLGVRGYIAVYTLFPLTMWLALRYFDRPQPARVAALSLSLALLLYLSFSSAVAVLVLAAYLLVVYRTRALRQGWLPAAPALALVAPLMIAKANLAVARTEATLTINERPFLSEIKELLLDDYGGNARAFWLACFAVATALAVVNHRRQSRSVALFLFLWPVGGAVLMYLTNPLLGLFRFNYAWWIMVGLALWMGWGLAYLPPRAQMVALAVLGGVMFLPLPAERYHGDVPTPPFIANFTWLRAHLVAGDALILDPHLDVPLEAWDYFERVYFPQGLPYAQDPSGYRRIWYVSRAGREDPALKAAIEAGRLPGIFVGPPELLIRLYEGPPDPRGRLFENGLRFHGADVLRDGRIDAGPLVRREGETIHLRLWWSVDEPPPFDYSVGTHVLDRRGNLIAQFDGPPQVGDNPKETSRWQPGQYYIEERTVRLPYGLVTGTYRLVLTVYQWWDNVRVPGEGTDEDRLLLLDRVYVKAW